MAVENPAVPAPSGETLPSQPAVEAPPDASPIQGVPPASETPVVEETVITDPVASPIEGVPATVPGEPTMPDAEKPGDKPEGDKPEGEAKPEPGKAAPPAYEAFKLPEGFAAGEEQLSAFTTLIGEHQLPQEKAQALIDLHTAAMKDYAERETQRQHDVFDKMQADWVKAVDKEFGNQRDTVLNNAKAAIAKFIPNAKQRAEFTEMLRVTGAGNHPAMLRFANAAFKATSERAAPPSPTPNNGQRGVSRADRRYGSQT